MKKLTKEEYINREPDLLSGEYMFIGKYENSSIKTLFRHTLCGYEWEITPTNFHMGQRCPKCLGHMVITKEVFCERESDIQSGEYKIVGDYKNTMTKTLLEHSVCGCKWLITPNKFHQGRRCPRCGGTQKLTKREFCEREGDIQSGEYEMLGDYVNTITKALFKHLTCGYEWKITPDDFHQGKRCPRCNGLIKLNKKQFIDRENDLREFGGYSMLGNYINAKTKTLFKHKICGYEWKITPDDFHQGKRCPRCNESKGEKCITSILKKLDIPFESQKRFDSCKYKQSLPFDFYVSDSFLVEYDGEQHFKSVDFAGKGNEWADKSFKAGQLRDNIKTQWAKDNGIPLVRIPYTEFDNIEQIIRDSVDKYCNESDGLKVII